jgi:hypothetical protein
MGIADSPAVPKIALVAPAASFITLNGRAWGAETVDLLARVISMGNCHRAFALTSAMCLAVAARIEGTVVHECVTRDEEPRGATPYPGQAPHGLSRAGGSRSNDIRLGHPSGVLPIDASVVTQDGQPYAERVRVYRTARRLMEGFVRVP